MKYEMHQGPEGLRIDIIAPEQGREVLVDAVTACGEGRCFCNTGEQRKLDGIEIEQQGDKVEIVMHAKPGEQFDCRKIGICLDVATRKAQRKE